MTGAKDIQIIVDSVLDPTANESWSSVETHKYFDIIGFDPRGINNTTPRLNCFPDTFSRRVWRLQTEAEGIYGSSDEIFGTIWARGIALSQGCSQMSTAGEGGNDGIGRFMNTPAVVADMVELLERHGQWREQNARSFLASKDGILTSSSELHSDPHSSISTLQRTRWKRGEEKLQYWGFSYGSVLGSTFAAMQPHRIQRAVLDGICDAPDYYQGDWLKNLQNTDAIIDMFCDYCHRGGPDRCDFYTGKDVQDIRAQLNQVIESIKDNPVFVQATEQRGPDIITYSNVMTMIRSTVYKPLEEFSKMAELLAGLRSGNGSAFAEMKQQQRKPLCLSDECREAGPWSEQCASRSEGLIESKWGILCSDAGSLTAVTPEDFKAYVDILRGQSRWLGEQWAEIRLGCVGWKVRPKWKFEGMFN